MGMKGAQGSSSRRETHSRDMISLLAKSLATLPAETRDLGGDLQRKPWRPSEIGHKKAILQGVQMLRSSRKRMPAWNFSFRVFKLKPASGFNPGSETEYVIGFNLIDVRVRVFAGL